MFPREQRKKPARNQDLNAFAVVPRKNSSAMIIEKRFRICTSWTARGSLICARQCTDFSISTDKLFPEKTEVKMRDVQNRESVEWIVVWCGWEMSSRQLTKQEESNYDVSTLALRCHVWCRLSETTRGNSKVIYYCRQPALLHVACLWTTRNILCNVSRRC